IVVDHVSPPHSLPQLLVEKAPHNSLGIGVHKLAGRDHRSDQVRDGLGRDEPVREVPVRPTPGAGVEPGGGVAGGDRLGVLRVAIVHPHPGHGGATSPAARRQAASPGASLPSNRLSSSGDRTRRKTRLNSRRSAANVTYSRSAARVTATWATRLSSSTASGDPMPARCGSIPCSQPGTKTTGHSRPLTPWMVATVTASSAGSQRSMAALVARNTTKSPPVPPHRK